MDSLAFARSGRSTVNHNTAKNFTFFFFHKHEWFQIHYIVLKFSHKRGYDYLTELVTWHKCLARSQLLCAHNCYQHSLLPYFFWLFDLDGTSTWFTSRCAIFHGYLVSPRTEPWRPKDFQSLYGCHWIGSSQLWSRTLCAIPANGQQHHPLPGCRSDGPLWDTVWRDSPGWRAVPRNFLWSISFRTLPQNSFNPGTHHHPEWESSTMQHRISCFVAFHHGGSSHSDHR